MGRQALIVAVFAASILAKTSAQPAVGEIVAASWQPRNLYAGDGLNNQETVLCMPINSAA
jgi:hypothetical protein